MLHLIPFPHKVLFSWEVTRHPSILRAGVGATACSHPFSGLWGESGQGPEVEVWWEVHGSSQEGGSHRPTVSEVAPNRRSQDLGMAQRGAFPRNTTSSQRPVTR